PDASATTSDRVHRHDCIGGSSINCDAKLFVVVHVTLLHLGMRARHQDAMPMKHHNTPLRQGPIATKLDALANEVASVFPDHRNVDHTGSGGYQDDAGIEATDSAVLDDDEVWSSAGDDSNVRDSRGDSTTGTHVSKYGVPLQIKRDTACGDEEARAGGRS